MTQLSAEVIDLCSLSPLGMDTIAHSLRRTPVPWWSMRRCCTAGWAPKSVRGSRRPHSTGWMRWSAGLVHGSLPNWRSWCSKTLCPQCQVNYCKRRADARFYNGTTILVRDVGSFALASVGRWRGVSVGDHHCDQ